MPRCHAVTGRIVRLFQDSLCKLAQTPMPGQSIERASRYFALNSYSWSRLLTSILHWSSILLLSIHDSVWGLFFRLLGTPLDALQSSKSAVVQTNAKVVVITTIIRAVHPA
jgi:hypothetical protein